MWDILLSISLNVDQMLILIQILVFIFFLESNILDMLMRTENLSDMLLIENNFFLIQWTICSEKRHRIESSNLWFVRCIWWEILSFQTSFLWLTWKVVFIVAHIYENVTLLVYTTWYINTNTKHYILSMILVFKKKVMAGVFKGCHINF